jgi:hypothetical protein
MSGKFAIGDHVRWNSKAGRVSGRIIKVHMPQAEYKGHPRHASDDESRSDKAEHIAMHSGAVLHKVE